MENKKIIFFVARYCGKCFAIRKRVKALIAEGKFNVEHEFIDIEIEEKKMKKYNIDGVPTTLVIKNGTEVKRVSGSLYLEDLEALSV